MRAHPLLKLALIAAAAAVVCAGVLVLGFLYLRSRPVDLPRPTGPYAVGRKIAYLRDLALWIWYPAEGRGVRAPYLPAAWREHAPRSWMTQDLGNIRTNSYLDASERPAPAELIFVPGYGRIPPYYSSLLEDLASRGYKIVAINPTGSAPVTLLSDGRFVGRTAAGTVPESGSREAQYAAAERLAHTWADYIRAVMDREQAESRVSRFGVIGHSLGGAAAAGACRVDERCAAAADLDGRLWNPVATEGLKRPLLLLLSEPSFADTGAEALGYERVLATAPGSELLRIRGMRHFNFTDWPLMFNPLLRVSPLTGSIDPRRAITITRAYVSAFFDRYVGNQDPPLLRGPAPEYPEVIWRR